MARRRYTVESRFEHPKLVGLRLYQGLYSTEMKRISQEL